MCLTINKMGFLRRKISFTGEVPSLETVFQKLGHLTSEKINFEYLQDAEGIFGAEISSEVTGCACTLLLPELNYPSYEVWCFMGARLDLLATVAATLLALGGNE